MGSKLEVQNNSCETDDCLSKAKNKKLICKKSFKKIWLTLMWTNDVRKGIMTDCVKEKLYLKFDSIKQNWKSNFNIRVRHYNKLESMDILDNSNPITRKYTNYYGKLINFLLSKGYTKDQTLFGFP
mmetsp:Transcript_53627/g.45029  ORF Transcript_53627/g.45029 Transcript_53627/m.45029 type:complete len:126 (+) Transcript_53627:99-476(+)